MLSKDIQKWNLERQIQQLASLRPEGEIAVIHFEHKGKYTDAAAMSAVCRVYSIFKCVYRRNFQITGSIPGLTDVVYLFKGKLALHYDSFSATFEAGELVLLSHNDHPVLIQADEEPVELVVLRCTGELTENFYRMIKKQSGIRNMVKEELFNAILDSLCYYMKYPADAANTRLALVMTQLFSSLLLDAMDRCAPRHPEWFVSAVDYIERNYQKEITLEDLCKHLQISKPHFHRIFAEYTNKSPYQYILDFRIQKAKELLSDPLLQVKFVSREVGFNNVNHFIKHFKKITGVTPGQYQSGRML
jgi:AraC-like DNA-binding protein